MLALHQLQDGLCVYAGGKETQPAKRVSSLRRSCRLVSRVADPGLCSAKYIEGLENRLGRMESLLRLSGLLSEDDGGKTDLGTLEKRLADRSFAAGQMSAMKSPNKFNASNSAAQSQQTTASRHSTPRMDSQSSPRTAATSPDSTKESETEVEGLSDMMCSLVTNNCGETRYIGMQGLSPHFSTAMY